MTPSISRRRGMSRQNKANRKNQVQEVAIRSVLEPYKADNVLNFAIRYQGGSSPGLRSVTRAMILNVLICNLTATTNNSRLCVAVRVNKIKITTSASATLEWLSAYGPTSATVVTATSTTAPGFLTQRPPKNSLCQYWSTSGSNESEILFQILGQTNDYIDVSFSGVLFDQQTPVSVTTQGNGVAGTVYRTYLDGPSAGAKWGPVYINSLF